jgi:hypothetical protein
MKGEECYTCSRRRSPCPPRGRRRGRGVQGRSQTLFAPRPATPQKKHSRKIPSELQCTGERAHLDTGREDALHHSPHPVSSPASAKPSAEGRPDESLLAVERPRNGGGSGGAWGELVQCADPDASLMGLCCQTPVDGP